MEDGGWVVQIGHSLYYIPSLLFIRDTSTGRDRTDQYSQEP